MRWLRIERARRRWERPSLPMLVLAAWLVLVGVFELLKPTAWSAVSLCPVKTLTDVPCPTCGSTRAVHGLLTGHWFGALAENPLMTVVVLMSFGWVIVRYGLGRRIVPDVGASGERRLWLALLLLLAANWLYVVWRGG
jgi:hypothetical protein